MIENPSLEPSGRRITTGLAKIGLALRSQGWRDASENGLTPTQGQILALLGAPRATPLRVVDLARALGVTAATTSDAARALARKGLVVKTRNPEDGRAIALGLTRRGKRAAARVAAWPDFLMVAVDALSPGEQAVFLKGLVKMIRTLQERGQIPIARMCVSCRFFRPNVHVAPEPPHHC